MSLEEFISDDSYGGSWADDEIDIASISVPIEKNKGMGGSDGSGGIFGAGGYGRSRNYGTDQGPPYIVKLLHLPVSCDDVFVKDLFTSRFMSFVKFKIVYDPVSNPLETGVVKKSAFVELHSFSDQNRVVNWQDLYYKGNRRVIIEHADFSDFQNCMKFNQEHDRDLRRTEREFLASKTRGSFEGRRSSHSGHIPGLGVLGELEDLQHHGRDNSRFGGSGRRSSFGVPGNNGPPHPKPLSRFTSSHTATPQTIDPSHETPALGPPKPKSNPFGNAKPVDILAREHELDKKIVNIDQNTITALSSDSDDTIKGKNVKKKELERLSSPEALALETTSAPEISTKEKISDTEADEGTKSEPIEAPSRKPKANDASKEKSEKPVEESKSQAPVERSRENSRRRKSSRGKRGSVGDVTEKTEKTEEAEEKIHKEQHHLAERNKSFSSQQRPDFKKHFIEMTSGSEERPPSRGSGGRGRGRGGRGGFESGRRNSHRKRSTDGNYERRNSLKADETAKEDGKVVEGEEKAAAGDVPQNSSKSKDDKPVDGQEEPPADEKNGRANSRGRGRGRGRGGRGFRGNSRGRGRGGPGRRSDGGESKDSSSQDVSKPPPAPAPADSQPAASA
ncbi:hypothetical protein CXQ85_002009 [Candidozyma haemuli]|uniref:Uncharacterized protein n=1 Tax=Candidozyma haemuli TaxID=45357 RepID=A0A2V1AR07_9ASCO|nr:hypothetical protein CXQ85_002009 [[Candida] haemuloni]PVH20225.1 hypothetical protein CXQ85_002009 [[Candida] haemuloni]